MKSYTYKDSGVDIEKADSLIEKLKRNIQETFNPLVLNPIGGFASLTDVPAHMKTPVLVTSTDGVGTKLKIAFLSGRHDTVGIDLVAMSVNDILTLGARPYFFLDYFACGRIDEHIYTDVINGICQGCKIAGCALIGGETAEMPSFYKDGEYDLAGFVIGFVDKGDIVDGAEIKEGDTIIALTSNGLHSNGFSLVRKILFDVHKFNVNDIVEGLNRPLYEELLKPTKIYVKTILDLLDRFKIKGMAHITGGGLPGNIKRIIPNGLCAHLNLNNNRIPDIFNVLRKLGNIPLGDMLATFNMGIGFIVIVSADDAQDILNTIMSSGEQGFIAGIIEKSWDDQKVRIDFI
ncbi:MAG TPA: phosphoribosylformylglycinamidine cyclo-ligase [Syntrophorhabdaceae bacterium]|nr:phosphoribosylformylglycinamidine cyclo-ligase [Syntrophorhabdaceae bacterium]HOL05005.1 phosphoribosylformylglycinamidine cyclo-ligase [Syntrophorhabdaceae bacterium]HPP41229.1 phosphoribosylformylglycinamidine cyclo-ligase [Syntrophorhabdaceae bacterium]